VQRKIKRPALFILSVVETFSIKKRLKTPEYLQASKHRCSLFFPPSLNSRAAFILFFQALSFNSFELRSCMVITTSEQGCGNVSERSEGSMRAASLLLLGKKMSDGTREKNALALCVPMIPQSSLTSGPAPPRRYLSLVERALQKTQLVHYTRDARAELKQREKVSPSH
jgi:hypothetical protein